MQLARGRKITYGQLGKKTSSMGFKYKKGFFCSIPTDLRVNVLLEQRAKSRFGQVIAGSERPIDVVDPREEGVRKSRDERDGPHEGDDADGAVKRRHGLRVERMADGQVTLHGEGDDRQHGGIRRPICSKVIHSFTSEFRCR